MSLVMSSFWAAIKKKKKKSWLKIITIKLSSIMKKVLNHFRLKAVKLN